MAHTTPLPFADATATVTLDILAEAMTSYLRNDRADALSRAANVEKALGYGNPHDGVPASTAWIREWWRTRGRTCSRCGVKK